MEIKRKIFPLKLWEMINDGRFQSALKWAEDGRSFHVYESELAKFCLGKENHLFFTKQPKSFVRQLHLYGFKKINKTQFKHYLFSRDDLNSVLKIKRGYKPVPKVLPSGLTPRSPQQPNYNENSLSDQSLLDYSTELEQPLSSSICSLCVCAGCCAL